MEVHAHTHTALDPGGNRGRKKWTHYFWEFTMSGGNSFLYHDRTVSQLKNSGNFRLIRKNNISDSLANYDSYINNTLRPVMESFRENRRYYSHMQNRFFNSEYFELVNQPHRFDTAVASRPDIIVMRNRDEDLFFEYCNELNGIANGFWFLNVMHRTLIRRASNLISLIKKEYHLK